MARSVHKWTEMKTRDAEVARTGHPSVFEVTPQCNPV